MGIRTSEDDDIVSRHVGGYVFLWDVFVVVIDVGVGGKDGYHLRGRRSISRQEFDGIPALPPLDYYR